MMMINVTVAFECPNGYIDINQECTMCPMHTFSNNSDCMPVDDTCMQYDARPYCLYDTSSSLPYAFGAIFIFMLIILILVPFTSLCNCAKGSCLKRGYETSIASVIAVGGFGLIIFLVFSVPLGSWTCTNYIYDSTINMTGNPKYSVNSTLFGDINCNANDEDCIGDLALMLYNYPNNFTTTCYYNHNHKIAINKQGYIIGIVSFIIGMASFIACIIMCVIYHRCTKKDKEYDSIA